MIVDIEFKLTKRTIKKRIVKNGKSYCTIIPWLINNAAFPFSYGRYGNTRNWNYITKMDEKVFCNIDDEI